MFIRALCIFFCCISCCAWSRPLHFERGWKGTTFPAQKPAAGIYFDDHRPCWVLGWGPNVLLSKVYYFDPNNGSQGTAVSESNFGAGLLLCGGMHVPLATFNENAGIGINVIPSIYGGLGYLGFNAPALVMLKYGQGATHYHTSDWCIGAGAGYGITAVQYYDLYSYAYSMHSPFFAFEFGYANAVFRFEVFERHHIAEVALPNRGEFKEYALQVLYYFKDR